MTLPRTRRILASASVAVLAGLVLAGCDLLDDIGGGTLPPGEEGVFTIVVGDGLDDGDLGETATTVPKVACDEPHDSEVFARTTLEGTLYPGGEELTRELEEFCRGDAFTRFVGVDFADSRYDTRGYYPTAESWANGDRELLCVIWDRDGAITGSVAGVAR